MLLKRSAFDFKNFELFGITPVADRPAEYTVSLSMIRYSLFSYVNFTPLQILLFYLPYFVIIVAIIIKLCIVAITRSNTT
jgi:hypothetical protein